MRIVGEQRLARSSALTRNDPVVTGCKLGCVESDPRKGLLHGLIYRGKLFQDAAHRFRVMKHRTTTPGRSGAFVFRAIVVGDRRLPRRGRLRDCITLVAREVCSRGSRDVQRPCSG